jgi:hypothetical protein
MKRVNNGHSFGTERRSEADVIKRLTLMKLNVIISNTSSIGVIQRHGLINILPDDAALRLIRKLNGTTQGHPEAIEQKDSYLFHAGF